MTDLAEIRAEGQRLLAEYRAGKPQAWLGLDDFLWKYADVLLADPAPMAHDDVAHDEGWAIAIISNVDAPEVGWPHQTEEWRTAARSWLDAVHTPAPVGLTEAEQKSLARSERVKDCDVGVVCHALRRLSAAPVGLTEGERRKLNIAHAIRDEGDTISPDFVDDMLAIIDRLSAAPDERERLAELEDWLLSAEHHAGCSGEYKKPDGAWAYRCKCGLRELRGERPVSPSDPEEEP